MTDVASGDTSDRDRPTARLLDPTTAGLGHEGERPNPTLYLGDRLLVAGYPRSARGLQLSELETELGKLGLHSRPTDRTERRLARARSSRALVAEEIDSIWASSVVIESVENPAETPDAWTVLQRLRASAPNLAAKVGLEHVVRPSGYWGGVGVSGYWGGVGGYWGGVAGYWGGVGGYWGGVGAVEEYGLPGRGGLSPVSVILPDPAKRAETMKRPPVIAVPDTAIHEHPWFTDPRRVIRLKAVDGALVPADPVVEPPNDPLTGQRSPFESHGTFIAGLIRQGCPEAVIVSVRVLPDDGVAEESDVLEGLAALLERHVNGQLNHKPGDVIDVLSLSLGYYAEDSTYLSSPTKLILDRFAAHGVLVVAGVGNDATDHPFVPASLASPLKASKLPSVSSVGAMNPEGQSVALFSNALTHVSALRLGVALVSTVPRVNGPAGSSAEATGEVKGTAAGLPRRTMDPDDYRGGFAVWSGTSFATPVLAAELAASLVAQGDLTDTTDSAMLRRARKALRAALRRKHS